MDVTAPARFAGVLPAETASADETQALGTRIAARLVPGDVVALVGGLGAGKTHLAKGLVEAFGADPDDVTSPTFTLVHEHDAPGLGALGLGAPGGLVLHLDLYRIETPAEAARRGLGAMLSGDAVALVEWPERAFGLLPPETLWLRLTPLGGDRRCVEEVERLIGI